MDHGAAELRDLAGQPVLGVVGQPVGVGDADAAVDVEVGLGVQQVAAPAHPHPAHRGHPGGDEQRELRPVEQLRLDGVHQPAVDVPDGGAQHGQDGDGDEQSHDGVGEGEPGGDAARAGEHGQGREAVGAGVQAVGDQRRRPDAAPHPDAVDRDQLVAEEADQSGRGDPAQVVDRRRLAPPAARLDGGEDRGRGDHRDDDEAREVLGAAVAVGVAAGGGPSSDDEGDPQGHRGQRVGGVVDRVGQQGHRVAGGHDQPLQDRRDDQRDYAGLHLAHAPSRGLQLRIHRVGGVVAVGVDEPAHPAAQATGMLVVVGMVVVVVVGVVVPLARPAGRAQGRSVAGVAASLAVRPVWVAAQLARSLSASSEGVPGSAV